MGRGNCGSDDINTARCCVIMMLTLLFKICLMLFVFDDDDDEAFTVPCTGRDCQYLQELRNIKERKNNIVNNYHKAGKK